MKDPASHRSGILPSVLRARHKGPLTTTLLISHAGFICLFGSNNEFNKNDDAILTTN